MKKLIKMLKIIYVKYILGQCKHSCLLCKYKGDCLTAIESEY